MTAARTGNVETVQTLLGARRRRERARAVVRRDGADVGGGGEPRRRWCGRWSRPGADGQRALDRARRAGAGVPAQRRPELAVPARRLDGADVRGARQGSIEAARALAELGADLNAVALPETDVPLKGEELTQRGRRASARRRWSSPSSTRTSIWRRCCSTRAPIRTWSTWPAMAALYAAVDMNSLQWMQGRPAPIFTDRLDAVDLVKKLLAEGRQPERAAEAPAAQASPRRRHDAQLRRGHDAARCARRGPTTWPSMKVLLDGGADPFVTLPDRTTTLMIAAGHGYDGAARRGASASWCRRRRARSRR